MQLGETTLPAEFNSCSDPLRSCFPKLFPVVTRGNCIDPFLPTLGCSVAPHTAVVVAHLELNGVSGVVGDGNRSLHLKVCKTDLNS